MESTGFSIGGTILSPCTGNRSDGYSCWPDRSLENPWTCIWTQEPKLFCIFNHCKTHQHMVGTELDHFTHFVRQRDPLRYHQDWGTASTIQAKSTILGMWPTSAFPSISTPSALLKELILTSGVFPWWIGELAKKRIGLVGWYMPMSPVTPDKISSLRNSIGLSVNFGAERSFLRDLK